MGSFLRSYKYGKIRVRLMRTEEDGNENMEHFVSVGARLASLPREWGGVYIYVACLAFAQLELPNVLEPSAVLFPRGCGGKCACVVCFVFAFS